MLSVLTAGHAEPASKTLTAEKVGGDTEAIPTICIRRVSSLLLNNTTKFQQPGEGGGERCT